MLGITMVSIGQAISLVGSGMNQFAITIWAWQETGQATTLALAGFFSYTPVVLLSPFAGVLVDRLNRKLVTMLSVLAAGVGTIGLLLLFTSNALKIWHIYALGAFVGVFQALQWPAYPAAITLMVPKKEYGRANGLLELARSSSRILAPILAGALISTIATPIAMLLAGPLADYIFEPAMSAGGTLATIFGPILGTGLGAGMALMFIISGLSGTLTGIGGCLFPMIREVETTLPDHDEVAPA